MLKAHQRCNGDINPCFIFSIVPCFICHLHMGIFCIVTFLLRFVVDQRLFVYRSRPDDP